MAQVVLSRKLINMIQESCMNLFQVLDISTKKSYFRDI